MFDSWTQEIFCVTVKSILHVCALEAYIFHISKIVYAEHWTLIDFQCICDVTSHARLLEIWFLMNTEKVSIWAMNVKLIL